MPGGFTLMMVRARRGAVGKPLVLVGDIEKTLVIEFPDGKRKDLRT